ncbi:MAG: HPF/RaiA family ribosome-associated protein, partial [Minisyncoccales bacterium]
MKIVIKITNIKLTEELRKFIERKINSLEKFSKDLFGKEYFDGFFGKGKPKIEAWVEIGKKTLHHRKGPFFYAECQMRFPGKSIRSESLKKNLKEAIIEVKEELEREIKEYKEKAISKFKRGARIFKKDLKISPLAR